MSYSFFYSLVATHYDTLNEKELDSHYDYLAQNLGYECVHKIFRIVCGDPFVFL